MALAATTRLAPSPTGALHLGNARTFLATWLLARQSGWKIVLRMEDLDGPRVRRNSAEQALDDLRWLGIDWDERAADQSGRAPAYAEAVDQLLQSGQAYPCVCTRTEVEQVASAPHADDGSARYPGTCRGRFDSPAAALASTGRAPAIRFRVPPGAIRWDDAVAGPRVCDVERDLGDFVIAKSDGSAAYQLAVVIDDAGAGVTQVVRGDDLLDSTPRQMLLYRALDCAGLVPTYYHLPLVVGPDGRRLAKRHGDTRLTSLRQAGVAPADVLTLLAEWLGIDAGSAETAASLLGRFDFTRVSRSPVVWAGEMSRRWQPA